MLRTQHRHSRRHRRPDRGPKNAPTGPTCEGCFPLSRAECDQCVRLVRIQGGRMLRKRLAELGMSPGEKIRVLQCYSGGPVIVAVKEDTRMAIGRGMAHKIIVRPQDEADAEEE